MQTPVYHMCFGCGRDNPIGLKLSFHREGELFYSEYVPPDHFQGYPGVLHGGIVSTLLDEVMANHIYTQGKRVVTADLYVRYKKPVPTGKPLRIVSRLKMARKRFFELEGWIEDTGGQVLAEGRAKMMEMEGNRVESQ